METGSSFDDIKKIVNLECWHLQCRVYVEGISQCRGRRTFSSSPTTTVVVTSIQGKNGKGDKCGEKLTTKVAVDVHDRTSCGKGQRDIINNYERVWTVGKIRLAYIQNTTVILTYL